MADVDRAKRFYEGLGWRLDADFTNGEDWHVVQMTPPGSPCSVMFGKGFTTAVPGSVQGTFLVVDDVEAARADLIARGVDVSEVFHFESNLLRVVETSGRVPGPDPNARVLLLVRVIQRSRRQQLVAAGDQGAVPGRGFSLDVATLTALLQEAEKRHGTYEPTAPKHHWSDWYAAYIVAREQGRTAEEAAAAGAQRIGA